MMELKETTAATGMKDSINCRTVEGLKLYDLVFHFNIDLRIFEKLSIVTIIIFFFFYL